MRCLEELDGRKDIDGPGKRTRTITGTRLLDWYVASPPPPLSECVHLHPILFGIYTVTTVHSPPGPSHGIIALTLCDTSERTR